MSNNILPPQLHWLGLILINIFPLVGVLFWQWSPLNIVLFYWVENIIIGIYVIARILSPSPDIINNKPEALPQKIFLSVFFIIHYGMFCSAHGLFIFDLFADDTIETNGELFTVIPQGLQWFIQNGLAWTLISLVVAHAIYYLSDLLQRNIETSNTEMGKPYKRIMVLHIAIILGGVAAQKFESGAMAVMLLIIALRIGMDIHFFKKDQKQAIKKAAQKNTELL